MDKINLFMPFLQDLFLFSGCCFGAFFCKKGLIGINSCKQEAQISFQPCSKSGHEMAEKCQF
jgi:hypothetical protein